MSQPKGVLKDPHKKGSQISGPDIAAALKRTRHGAPSLRSHGLDTDTNYDVYSMADKSDFHFRKINYENTYKMEPDHRFSAHEVERAAEGALKDRLEDLKYDPQTCKKLSQELAAEIMERVKLLGIKRYKFVVVVSIGSLKEKPGMNFGSRCLWNHKTDNFANVKFTNGSLFAIALIYGMYYE